MPEGPETYALGLALKKDGFNAQSYGKHLYLPDIKEDWSFGLNGRVHIDSNHKLTKVNAGFVNGSIKHANNIQEVIENNKLGINFIDANSEQLGNIIDKWQKSRKKLGGLILDQSQIAGIGVAWGSEILHIAGDLHPDIAAKDQNLSKLSNAMLTIRNYIKQLYENYVNEHDGEEIINGWFDNLYTIRSMKVYKKSTKIETGGRSWWIKSNK